jgi:hypothetical protein
MKNPFTLLLIAIIISLIGFFTYKAAHEPEGLPENLSDEDIEKIATKWWATDPTAADHSSMNDMPAYIEKVKKMSLSPIEGSAFLTILSTNKKRWTAGDQKFVNELLNRLK